MTTKKKHSWKDVLLELSGPSGLAGVALLNASRPVLRKAMQQLKDRNDENYKKLEGWCFQTHGFKLDNYDARAPKDGETRSYKAQGNENETPFLKIPLDVLGIKKGEYGNVRFSTTEGITVLPKGS